METGIKSSFIPTTPLAPAPLQRRTGGGAGFLLILGLVIFVASVTLAVGVFLYAQYLDNAVNSKLDQLERAKDAFEPSLINELTRLDDRMREGDKVLASHLAPTALFLLLEKLTLQTVSFSSFSFDASDAANINVSMNGLAASVNSVALQADLLSQTGFITNPLFSNINREAAGIKFDFTATIDTASLQYRTLLAPPPQAQVPAEVPPPSSPFGDQ